MAALQFYDAVISGNLRSVIEVAARHKFDLNDFFRDFRERDHQEKCPLHVAALKGYRDMVRYLIEAGCDVNKQTAALRRTPLHFAVNGRRMDCFRALIAAGVELNSVDTFGYPALHYAAEHGLTDMLDILILKGADIDMQDITMKTALMKAVRSLKTQSVKKLLKAGCKVNVQNQHGDTALHFASRMGACEMIRLLIESGAGLNFENTWGQTPLMEAVNYNRSEAVKRLVDLGCDVNIRNTSKGEIALHAAMRKNHTAIVKILLEAGSRADILNYQGVSPAYEIAAHNYVDTLKVLIKLNYDLDAPGRKCGPVGPLQVTETLYQIASRAGHLEICCLLAQFNCDSFCVRDGNVAHEQYTSVSRPMSWLNVNSPLQSCCRKVVRKELGRDIFTRVKELPLPKAIQEFLCAGELDLD